MVGLRIILFIVITSVTSSYAQNTCAVEVDSYTGTYESLKSEIRKRRASMFKQMNSVSKPNEEIFMDSVGYIMHRIVTEDILCAWNGTEWAFSGYTAIPNQGTIACGYFVSTTLRDIGFNLDRYKLAQKSPTGEGRSLFLGKDPIAIHQDSLMQYVSCLADGLYFLGLSNHVGFLSIENGNHYFIHSNYINAAGVMKERLECSEAVQNSYSYLLVPLSTHNAFIKAWLLKKRIEVFKE